MGEQPVQALLDTEFAGEWGEGSAGSGLCECRVLRATNLTSNGIDYSTAAQRFVSEAKVEMKRLRRGDLILEAAGGGPGVPVGRVAQFDPPDEEWGYLVSNFFRTLRPDSNADCRFVYHMLDNLYQQPRIWQVQQQTTGIINLKVKDYLQLRVPVPPLEAQRRIAEILDTIDETIRATEHVIAKSILIEQGLKWDLVGRRSAADDGWERVTIGDLGLVVTGGTPPTTDERYWNGPVPFITPGDINARSDIRGTDRHVTQLGARLVKRIPPGSIAIVCIGSTIGKIGRVHECSVTNQQINSVIPSAEHDSEFVACVSELARHRLVAEAGRQAVPIVNASTLRSLPVDVCPSDVQREIGDHLALMRDRIASEYAVLAKLRRLRFGLAAELLSGRVRTVVA